MYEWPETNRSFKTGCSLYGVFRVNSNQYSERQSFFKSGSWFLCSPRTKYLNKSILIQNHVKFWQFYEYTFLDDLEYRKKGFTISHFCVSDYFRKKDGFLRAELIVIRSNLESKFEKKSKVLLRSIEKFLQIFNFYKCSKKGEFKYWTIFLQKLTKN